MLAVTLSSTGTGNCSDVDMPVPPGRVSLTLSTFPPPPSCRYRVRPTRPQAAQSGGARGYPGGHRQAPLHDQRPALRGLITTRPPFAHDIIISGLHAETHACPPIHSPPARPPLSRPPTALPRPPAACVFCVLAHSYSPPAGPALPLQACPTCTPATHTPPPLAPPFPRRPVLPAHQPLILPPLPETTP